MIETLEIQTQVFSAVDKMVEEAPAASFLSELLLRSLKFSLASVGKAHSPDQGLANFFSSQIVNILSYTVSVGITQQLFFA